MLSDSLQTSDGSDTLFDDEGSPRKTGIRETALPVIRRWERDGTIESVRSRVRSLFGAGLLVVAIQLFLDPGGLTGMLISLWFLLSLPVVAVASLLLLTLRQPRRAREVWWEDGPLVTLGLVMLATLVRSGRTSPTGRAVWQLAFDEDGPDDDSRLFGAESTVDVSGVSRLRRYLLYAILGSVAVILLESTLLRGGVAAVSVPVSVTGPVEWAALFAAALVVGSILGFFLKVTRT